ncbi:ComEC/Rec2 family competence protein [Pedobacter nototheniae]|uniref:ComEC/Rec2 family competence protein n=1 Tax=Pedobacter nototheniae TaxID=2488994 RepID=UPI00292CF20D|nr:ComEC/Rec2 family competence protein [Pedobacter nototheniae]
MFKAEYIFVRILLPFLFGIGLFYYLPNQKLLLTTVICTTILFFTLLIINIIYKKLDGYKFKGLLGISFFIFFFLFGGMLCLLNNNKLQREYFTNGDYPALKVRVNNEPDQNNGILRFKAVVLSGYYHQQQVKLSGELLVALKLDSLSPLKLKYGDEIIITSKYTAIEPSFNPAEFDYKSWMANQNIFHQTFLNQNQLIKIYKNSGNPIIKFALGLREKQIFKYRRLIKNDEAFAVASTLILGYRADLSKETLTAYSKTGTIHALSVSGAHVAIIYVVLDFLLMFLNRKRTLKLKIVKFILICTLIWAYALITGLSPSVVRSAIMITIFITAKTYSRDKNSYNILAFSAFCQLVYNPFLLWDVGFQLSYLAVFGLIYLQPKIYGLLFIKNKWLDKLWNFTALSLAAQLITFPLSIYYFHQFPVYFLLGNLFITLPLVVMMYLGILILIPGLSFLAPLFEWIINFTNQTLKWISNLPLSTFSSIWINLSEFILLSLVLGLFIYAIFYFNKRSLFAAFIIFIIYQVLVISDDIKALNQREIIFFSLNKNYAVAFIDGRHAILLTDLNIENKNYKFFVDPALQQRQIKRLNLISLKSDTVFKDFILKNQQIIFHQYKMLIIDEKLNYKMINNQMHFSSIWLHQNTKYKLEKLKPSLQFKDILVDASNKDYRINAFKLFAENNKIDIHVLKKNKAYLVDLKP